MQSVRRSYFGKELDKKPHEKLLSKSEVCELEKRNLVIDRTLDEQHAAGAA